MGKPGMRHTPSCLAARFLVFQSEGRITKKDLT